MNLQPSGSEEEEKKSFHSRLNFLYMQLNKLLKVILLLHRFSKSLNSHLPENFFPGVLTQTAPGALSEQGLLLLEHSSMSSQSSVWPTWSKSACASVLKWAGLPALKSLITSRSS